MLAEQCVSVTELARNASGIVKRAERLKIQYVFVNNAPKAVVMDMASFERLGIEPVEMGAIDESGLARETKDMAARSRKLPESAFLDA